MKIIQKTLQILLLSLSVAGSNGLALAAESPNTSGSSNGEVISHIEKAIAEIAKSDFNTAQVHLKAARAAADKIAGHEDTVKKANALVIQGQIIAKKGDIQNSTAQLQKAIEVYQSF